MKKSDINKELKLTQRERGTTLSEMSNENKKLLCSQLKHVIVLFVFELVILVLKYVFHLEICKNCNCYQPFGWGDKKTLHDNN